MKPTCKKTLQVQTGPSGEHSLPLLVGRERPTLAQALEIADAERSAAKAYPDLHPLADALDRLAHAYRWHATRWQALQKAQAHMRDPERKAVCDILANGETYVYASNNPLVEYADSTTNE